MTVKFVNPYNFIPLAKEKAKGTAKRGHNVGVIEYTLTTKSPVFIPNTSSNSAFKQTDDYARANEGKENGKHISRDFFSYRELTENERYEDAPAKPVIPGSEIRGMIRNIYETLTDSCMGVLNEETIPTRRNQEVFQPGLIKRNRDGSLQLYDAVDCIYRTTDDWDKKEYESTKYKEGQKVYFNWEEADRENCKPLIRVFGGENIGYVLKGMKGPQMQKPALKYKEKHNMHIFCLSVHPHMLRNLTTDDTERLMEVITMYRSQVLSTKKEYNEYEEQLKKFERGEGEEYFPVYYSFVNDRGLKKDQRPLYLSPASVTREVFNTTLGTLAGKLVPCKVKKSACPACSLFGMVGNSNEEAIASKIRFTDATVLEEKQDVKDYYMPNLVTLEELSSPKIQNVEFYLKRPTGAMFWTYDYYVQGLNQVKVERGELRGRKYYWHHPNVKLKDTKKTNRNSTIRPLNENVKFKGKLYFDGITDTELKRLVWIMNCGSVQENSEGDGKDGKIMYKIGTGKPLGLGSIRLSVTGVKERTLRMTDNAVDYVDTYIEEIPIVNYGKAKFNMNIKDEFMLISKFHDSLENIHYPGTGGEEEGFQWYAQNHLTYVKKNQDYGKGMGQKREELKLEQSLPLLSQGLEEQKMVAKYKTIVTETGVIKWFDGNKLYGCVVTDKTNIEVRFGDKILKNIDIRELKEGSKVQISYQRNDKKRKYDAKSIEVISNT